MMVEWSWWPQGCVPPPLSGVTAVFFLKGNEEDSYGLKKTQPSAQTQLLYSPILWQWQNIKGSYFLQQTFRSFSRESVVLNPSFGTISKSWSRGDRPLKTCVVWTQRRAEVKIKCPREAWKVVLPIENWATLEDSLPPAWAQIPAELPLLCLPCFKTLSFSVSSTWTLNTTTTKKRSQGVCVFSVNEKGVQSFPQQTQLSKAFQVMPLVFSTSIVQALLSLKRMMDIFKNIFHLSRYREEVEIRGANARLGKCICLNCLCIPSSRVQMHMLAQACYSSLSETVYASVLNSEMCMCLGNTDTWLFKGCFM